MRRLSKIRVEPGHPLRLVAGALDVRLRGFGEVAEVLDVAAHEVGGQSALAQALARELVDRFQHAVALAAVRSDHQRLARQLGEQVGDAIPVEVLAGTDRRGGLRRASSCEHRQSREKRSLVDGQQLVAPVDQRVERLLPRQCGAASAGEQAKAVVQAREHPLERHGPDAGRGELDRERDAIEAGAESACDRMRRIGEREVGLFEPRTVDEERDRIGKRRIGIHVIRGERCQRKHLFAGRVEVLAAGREDGDARRMRQHRSGEARARVDQVLAVVEDDEKAPVRDLRAHRLHQARLVVHAQSECLGDRPGHQPCVGQRGQIDEPGAVGVVVEDVGGDLQRQARLPNASRTGDRHQAMPLQQALHFRDFVRPAEERGHL